MFVDKNSPSFISKFYLVEELALDENIQLLHSHSCTVIGRMKALPQGKYELQNVRFFQQPSEYSLPTGIVGVSICSGNEMLCFEGERVYEVFGEIKVKSITNNENKIVQKPTILAWHIREISRPSDLIMRNLQIRLLTTNDAPDS